MAGHASMDMSKPMEQGKSSSEERKDSTMTMPMGSSGHGGTKKKGKEDKKNTRTHVQRQGGMDDMQMGMGQPADSAKMIGGDSVTKNGVSKKIDPVCGMEADPSGKYSFAYEGKTYYFCSEEDREKFKSDPANYARHDHDH